MPKKRLVSTMRVSATTDQVLEISPGCRVRCLRIMLPDVRGDLLQQSLLRRLQRFKLIEVLFLQYIELLPK
jgi:hypothetical protein